MNELRAVGSRGYVLVHLLRDDGKTVCGARYCASDPSDLAGLRERKCLRCQPEMVYTYDASTRTTTWRDK